MIKDLLLHVDGTSADTERLAHAQALASWLEEPRLTAIYTDVLPDFSPVMGVDAGLLIEVDDQFRRKGDHVVARLKEQLNSLFGIQEVRRVDALPRLIGHRLASLARCHDLFIATTPYGSDAYPTWGGAVEAVIFGSGCCSYLVPAGCPVRSELGTVLVGWKDTVEVARLLRAGLPLLQRATRVRLLAVRADGDRDMLTQMSDVAAHLDRCNVTVETKTVSGDNRDVGAIICDEARACAADLIAIGAYGHSRLREFILGGVTHSVIERSTLPILLAH